MPTVFLVSVFLCHNQSNLCKDVCVKQEIQYICVTKLLKTLDE